MLASRFDFPECYQDRLGGRPGDGDGDGGRRRSTSNVKFRSGIIRARQSVKVVHVQDVHFRRCISHIIFYLMSTLDALCPDTILGILGHKGTDVCLVAPEIWT